MTKTWFGVGIFFFLKRILMFIKAALFDQKYNKTVILFFKYNFYFNTF